jgi:hypothetical protein
MAKETDIRRRKNYSIHPDRASELARASLDMSEEIGTSVKRQNILDTLVHLLATDSTVYNKVKKAIKNA